MPALLAPQLRVELLKLSNGDLEQDLLALPELAGLAAQRAETALILFIDELQYVDEDELAALTMALHRCAQRALPIALFGAGLPQLPGKMGRARIVPATLPKSSTAR